MPCLPATAAAADRSADLKTFNQKYRSDAAGYSIPIQLRNGATNDQSNPGVEAMLDVETVVSQTYPLNR